MRIVLILTLLLIARAGISQDIKAELAQVMAKMYSASDFEVKLRMTLDFENRKENTQMAIHFQKVKDNYYCNYGDNIEFIKSGDRYIVVDHNGRDISYYTANAKLKGNKFRKFEMSSQVAMIDSAIKFFDTAYCASNDGKIKIFVLKSHKNGPISTLFISVNSTEQTLAQVKYLYDKDVSGGLNAAILNFDKVSFLSEPEDYATMAMQKYIIIKNGSFVLTDKFKTYHLNRVQDESEFKFL